MTVSTSYGALALEAGSNLVMRYRDEDDSPVLPGVALALGRTRAPGGARVRAAREALG